MDDGGPPRYRKAHWVLDDRPATFQEYQMLQSAKSRGSQVNTTGIPEGVQTQHGLMNDTKYQERGSSKVVRPLVSAWPPTTDPLGRQRPVSEFKQNSGSAVPLPTHVPTRAPQELLHRFGARAKTWCRIGLRLGCQGLVDCWCFSWYWRWQSSMVSRSTVTPASDDLAVAHGLSFHSGALGCVRGRGVAIRPLGGRIGAAPFEL